MARKIDSRWAAECEVRFMQALRSKIAAKFGEDDDTLLRDTIEGAAKVDEAMEMLLAEYHDEKAQCEARRKLAASYTAAAKANDERASRVKALILECLQAAGQEKWTGIAGTAYERAGSWSTEIVNPMAVPLEYQKAEPNIARIREELEALRLELEAMGDRDLCHALKIEGSKEGAKLCAAPWPVDGLTALKRAELIAEGLSLRVPGVALIQGEASLTVLLPRGKKAEAA